MLRLPNGNGLKAKRQVARSLTSRIRSKFNVSVSEGEDQELWQRLTLVVGAVGSNAGQINEMLSQVADFVAEIRPDLEVLGQETEIISGV
jgi:uncharacterized protein YlxP (DUF503 family)